MLKKSWRLLIPVKAMNNFPQGLGIDVIEIERFKNTLKRTPRIVDKLFTAREMAYCKSKGKNQILHLAGRFAVKEAIAKALLQGFGRNMSFLDLEIINQKAGDPIVKLSTKLQKKFPKFKILISISHSKTVATACAFAYKLE